MCSRPATLILLSRVLGELLHQGTPVGKPSEARALARQSTPRLARPLSFGSDTSAVKSGRATEGTRQSTDCQLPATHILSAAYLRGTDFVENDKDCRLYKNSHFDPSFLRQSSSGKEDEAGLGDEASQGVSNQRLRDVPDIFGSWTGHSRRIRGEG